MIRLKVRVYHTSDHHTESSVTDNDAQTCEQAVRLFAGALQACGYHRKSIHEALEEISVEMEDADKVEDEDYRG